MKILRCNNFSCLNNNRGGCVALGITISLDGKCNDIKEDWTE